MWWICNLVSVAVFCYSARHFLNALTERVSWERRATYSTRALRVEKSYRVFAWGMMTFIWVYLCLISFLQSFSQTEF